MSGTSFAVDTETFMKASPEVLRLVPRVQESPSTLGSTVSSLQESHSTPGSTVSSLGECRGNDVSGYPFAQQYEQTKAQMWEGLDSVSKVRDRMAGGIHPFADGSVGKARR